MLAPVAVAAAGRRAFVRVNFKANLCRHRQNQDLARLVAARMADERIFARGGGRSPKDYVANTVFWCLLIAGDCLGIDDLGATAPSELHPKLRRRSP